MAQFVAKRSGTKVPFDEGKITSAIAACAKEAGLADEKVAEISQKVSASVASALADTQEVSSLQIRDKVLETLDKEAPEVSAEWRKYDQSMGK